MTYGYVRSGNGRRIAHEGLSQRQALALVFHSLVDNGYADKAAAASFVSTVEIGTPATFAPYTFTVSRDET